MDLIRRFFRPHRSSASPLSEVSGSHLLTKSHGLHDLGLCEACQNIDLEALTDGVPRAHLKNCFDLIETSKQCRLCAYIAYTLQDGRSQKLSSLIWSYDVGPNSGIPLSLVLRNNCLEAYLGDHRWVPQVEIFTDEGSLTRRLILANRNKASEHELLSALRQGSPPCFANQDDVAGSRDVLTSTQTEVEPFLPARVVDLGDAGQSQRLHLHATSPNERGHYATLSYRWGGKVPLRTTRRTLKRHIRSLETQTLPQTFQDAITITRLLGIRFLWIDALCIIQDDHQDWLDQAAKMGSTYQHSLMTIAVHSAKDPLEGFLWRRSISNVLQISPRSPRSAFWLEIPALSDQVISRGIRGGQIVKRAWIFQELYLSKRVIHFVEDRIIWECCHEEHLTGSYSSGDYFAEVFHKRAISTSEEPEDWLSFVKEYSSCQITKTSDKLPAIAGLAQAWPRDGAYFAQGGYYSGIFANDMHNSLLWYCKGRDTVRQPNVAPSWSWASVDGRISFIQRCHDSAELLPRVEVASFDCKCGVVTKSHLTCKSYSIRLHAVVASGIEIGFPEKGKRFSFCPRGNPRYVTTLLRRSKRVGWAIFDDARDQCDQFQCVQVAAVSIENKITGFCVLIVKSCSGDEVLTTRIGMGYIFRTRLFEASPRAMITIL